MSKELLHIVYLSKAKLDLYYPQIPARFLAGASAKITLHIGVADLYRTVLAPASGTPKYKKLIIRIIRGSTQYDEARKMWSYLFRNRCKNRLSTARDTG